MSGHVFDVLRFLRWSRRSSGLLRAWPGLQPSEGSGENTLGFVLRQVFFLNESEGAQGELQSC